MAGIPPSNPSTLHPPSEEVVGYVFSSYTHFFCHPWISKQETKALGTKKVEC